MAARKLWLPKFFRHVQESFHWHSLQLAERTQNAKVRLERVVMGAHRIHVETRLSPHASTTQTLQHWRLPVKAPLCQPGFVFVHSQNLLIENMWDWTCTYLRDKHLLGFE